MDQYDFHRQNLKPSKAYRNIITQSHNIKPKAATERSKSKQKLVVTSFSKKQLAEINANKSPLSASSQVKKFSRVESDRQKQCQSEYYLKKQSQSEYYIKTAETKTELDPLQLQDELRLKDEQLELITKRLAKAEIRIKELTNENKLKTDRIETIQKEMNILLTKSLNNFEGQSIGVDLAFQCQKYKQQQKRLLQMLQTTTQYQYFSKFALLDTGVELLSQQKNNKSSSLDANHSTKIMHYCSCHKQLISESSFWVPEKVYAFGKDFIKERKGDVTKSQFQLLLYEMNRIWREREKKIINTLNGQKARQLEKLKRKEANSRSLRKSSFCK